MAILGDSGLIVPDSSDPDSVLGYIREAVQEGDNFLRKQRGYLKIDLTQRFIMGEFPNDIRSADLSQVTDNEFGSIAENLQALYTDTRPFIKYQTKNPDYRQQSDILNACFEHWWLGRQIDMRFRDAINGALAGGTSCFWITWNPWLRDLEVRVIDGRDALPGRPSSYHSYQDCEILTIRQERSVNELRRRFASFADRIVADRDGAAALTGEAESYSSRVIAAMGKSPFTLYREFITKAKAAMSGGAFPVADLFTSYLKDYRRNEGPSDVLMGPWSAGSNPQPRRPWSYRVKRGDLLYPGGRVVVATNTAVLYDGPNSYWHDHFPALKLTLLQWPFPDCYLGKSPLWDLIDEQRELNATQRAIADHTQKFVEPDLVIDQNAGVSKSSAEKIRARKAGGKFFRRPGPGEGFRFEYPPPLPAEIINRPDAIIARMRSKAGTFDMANILNKGQLPANETLDAMLNVMTGSVRAVSRTLEAFVRELGYQMASNIAQHYTRAMRLAIRGPLGTSIDDYDFDPNSLVPMHVGSDYGPDNAVLAERMQQPRPRRDRWQELQRYFETEIAPNSMLNSANFDEDMRYMQLARGGFIDLVTMLEHMRIANIGQEDIPGGDKGTIIGRLLALSQANLLGQVGPAGRKSSGQQPPQMKSSGAISESG
jgi:hypothetical protein